MKKTFKSLIHTARYVLKNDKHGARDRNNITSSDSDSDIDIHNQLSSIDTK